MNPRTPISPHSSSPRRRPSRPLAVLLAAALTVTLAGSLTQTSRAEPSNPSPLATPLVMGYVSDGQDYSAVNDAVYTEIPKARSGGQSEPPGFYDPRQGGLVPAVRDQGQSKDCWAFSATGSAMTDLAQAGYGNVNLSPSHLVYAVYGNRATTDLSTPGSQFAPWNKSSNNLQAASAWAKWFGPRTEKAYPHDQVQNLQYATKLKDEIAYGDYHQRNAWILPRNFDGQGNYDKTNVRTVKEAIMNYGALSVPYHADAGQTNNQQSCIYDKGHAGVFNPRADYTPPSPGCAGYDPKYDRTTNHVVMIVGWRDDYPATNFSITAPGNGAWIVQNSWGTGVGEAGYFYLSYYDASAANPWAFDLVSVNDDWGYIYSWDDGLPQGRVLDCGSRTAFEANVFTVTRAKPEALRAVSFYSQMPQASYEVSVYRNPKKNAAGIVTDPTSGERQNTGASGTIPFAGWNRVDLSSRVILSPGDTFAVVLKLTNLNEGAVSWDCQSGYDGAASFSFETAYDGMWLTDDSIKWAGTGENTRLSNPGQSFLKADIAQPWTDVANSPYILNHGNVALKAVTDYPSLSEWPTIPTPSNPTPSSPTSPSATASVGPSIGPAPSVTPSSPTAPSVTPSSPTTPTTSPSPARVVVAPSEDTAPAGGGLLDLVVTTTSEGWTLSGLPPWAHTTPTSGPPGTTKVKLTIDAATTTHSRQASLTITSGGATATYVIHQNGQPIGLGDLPSLLNALQNMISALAAILTSLLAQIRVMT